MFVFLPTGFGKSVCFQVLPFLFDHKLGLTDGSGKRCVIVVSPLVSLMVDQVMNRLVIFLSATPAQHSLHDKTLEAITVYL